MGKQTKQTKQTEQNTQTSRRVFLSTAGPAAILGTHALRVAGAPKIGPNETIRMGLIGCGGRGRAVMHNFLKLPGVEFVAVCDLHKGRLAEGLKAAGGKAKRYHDYRKLLEDKSIDAVLIATNGHWHVLPTIAACAAGKDVYVEKPLGTSIGEGRAAVKAARKYNRVVQIGTQQHNWEHYKQAVKVVRSGVLGDISNVHVWDLENQYPGYGSPADCAPPPELDWDFWVGPSPQVAYNPNRFIHHYWFHDYGGAWQLDWAVHHYDIVHWAMGVSAPVSATAFGGKFAFANDNREWPDTFDAACEYPSGPVAKNGFLMTYTFNGGCNHPIDGCHHAKAFHGTDGTLVLNRAGWTIYSETRNGKKIIEEKHSGGSRENHAAVFLDCMRSRKRPAADIEVGHFASNPGHLMNIAYRLGRKVRWDARQERILSDAEADAMVTKKYRKPWSLKV